IIILSLGLLSCVAARSTVGPVLFNPPVSQFGVFPGPTGYAVAPVAGTFGGAFPTPLTASLASPLGNAPGPAPLAVSSSQRLDYFNQFNAAFAPNAPARILAATPTGRLIAPGVAGPFFF
ncbi:hypothetical protein KR026_008737, partial [Drosophila bipectinata]